MRNDLRTLVFAATAATIGCGDSGGRDDGGASASAGLTLTAGSTSITGTVSASASTSDSGSGSASDSADPTEGVTSGVTTNSSGDSSGVKFDLGAVPDAGMACGPGGEPDFSYIWVANSTQGTISKINTVTLVEEGRYIVRPDQNGSPSRTSVSLTGDVVTANRSGGITKVYARPERCQETNGMPGIQTATDGNFLPWGVEECVAWHTPMAYESQRPVAWTQGTFNKGTCQWENQKVWTSGNNGADGQLDVLLVNGDTGAIEATVNVQGITPDFYGIYGAAVDGQGNFWGSQLSQGHLVFIDIQTLQYKVWPMAAPGYGMTVDSKGYVWTCNSAASRFDPMTESWQTAQVGGSGGCMEDGKGTLYMSGGGNNIVAVDAETLQIKDTIPVPNYVHGVSIDFYGYVWGVSYNQPDAYRVDPVTKEMQTFSGLVGPYTYSDMTGFALSNAGTPTG